MTVWVHPVELLLIVPTHYCTQIEHLLIVLPPLPCGCESEAVDKFATVLSWRMG